MGTGRARRVLGLGLLAAVLAGPPASVQAAIGPTYQLRASLYDHCVGLTGPAGYRLTVTQRRDGDPIRTVDVTSEASTRVCLRTLLPGDVVTTTQNDLVVNTAVLPTLTLSLDLENDIVRGTAPTSVPAVQVHVTQQIAGLEVDSSSDSVSVAPDGTFSTTVGVDLTAGDPVTLRWTSSTGDVFELLESTPSIVVRTGRASFTMTAKRGTRAVLRLLHGTSARGSFLRRLPAYETAIRGTFRRKAAAVRVRPGDTITHSGQRLSLMTVLPSSITFSPANNGTVETTCFPYGPFSVRVNDERPVSFRTSPIGRVQVSSLSAIKGPLVSGDLIEVRCESLKGGGQIRTVRLP